MDNVISLIPKNARPAAQKAICFETQLARLTAAHEELTGAIKSLFARLNTLDRLIEIAADPSEKERLTKQSIGSRKELAQALCELTLQLTRMKGLMQTRARTH